MLFSPKVLARIPAIILVSAVISQGAEIVVPPDVRVVDGNDTGLAPTTPTRLQYLYDAAFFEAKGKIEISGLAWRPDAAAGVFSATDEDVSISLSTFSGNSLGRSFASNTGANEAKVFRGAASLNAVDQNNPREFSLAIDFQESFVFDPSDGNLLVDVTFSGFDKRWTVDNHEFADDKARFVSGPANSANATREWNLVAPMQFDVRPVPEPATCSMSLAAVAIIGMVMRRRQQ